MYEYLLSPCFQQFGVQALLCFLAPESGEGRLPGAVQCAGTVCLCAGHAERSAPTWRACGPHAASSSWPVIIQNVGRQTRPGCCALLGLGRVHGHAGRLTRENLLHHRFVPARALHPGAMLGPCWDQAQLLWADLPAVPVSSLQENLQLQSRAWEPVTWSSSWWPPLPWWRGQLPFSSCATRG